MTYEEFLEHAEECERLAEAARLPSNRHALLSSAEMWRKMAADTRPRDEAGFKPSEETREPTHHVERLPQCVEAKNAGVESLSS